MTPLSLPNYTFLMITHSFSINTVKKNKVTKIYWTAHILCICGHEYAGGLSAKAPLMG